MNAAPKDLADSKTHRELLVIHAGSLGDCVLAIHLTHTLQRHWNARSTLIARSGIAKWAEQQALVARSMSVDCSVVRGLVNENLDDRREVEGFLSGYDRIVSFLGDASQPIARRISQVVGNRAFHIDPRAKTTPPESGLHITEQWLMQLANQGLDVSDVAPDAPTDSGRARDDFRSSLARRSNRNSPIVLIHPGSGGLNKCVPIELLEDVARKLNSQSQVAACWVVGPDEYERFGPTLISNLEKSAPVLYEESIERAADFVAGADLYIGHDAGMTHVAALAGVPTVAIFGPTNPRVWSPLGTHCHLHSFPTTADSACWADELARRSLDILHKQSPSGA